mgnify:CR=1 FL=1
MRFEIAFMVGLHSFGKLFLFLTKDYEVPDDDVYLCASYSQVHRCLTDALNARRHAIGAEPRVLIENYLRMLEEHFMSIYKMYNHI